MANRIVTEQIVTPEFTLLFRDLEQVNEMSKKYRVVANFDEGEKLGELKRAMKAAAVSKWGDKIPKLHSPIKTAEEANKKAEEQDKPGYYVENTLHVALQTKKPYLLDVDGDTALTPDKFYPGCRCRAVVTPWPYDGTGDKLPGVTLMLEMLQFVRDGERLGGGIASAKALLKAKPLKIEDEAPAIEDDDNFSF